MSLEQDINSQMKEAMLSQNKAKLRGLRAIKAAILIAKTEKGVATEISTEAELLLLQKLIKQRKDSLEIYKDQNREDLATQEKEEIEVIESFLPAQLSEADLTKLIQDIVLKVGANEMKDMGKVMGLASKEFAGKADGKTISTIVKQILSK